MEKAEKHLLEGAPPPPSEGGSPGAPGASPGRPGASPGRPGGAPGPLLGGF